MKLLIILIVTALLVCLAPSVVLLAAPPAQPAPPLRSLDIPKLPFAAPETTAEFDATAPQAVDFVPWSKLVFQSYRNNNWEIYRANSDGSGAVRLTNNGAFDIDPRLNRGATRIAFASNRTGNYEVFAMSLTGSGVTNLTNQAGDDLAPAWSPDGSKIAFETYRHGAPNVEVYIMNANGSGQTRLTNSAGYDGTPVWSPDGTKIAFTSKRGGRYQVWVMNADGSNPQALSTQPNAYDPAWSPDGARIAYDADGNNDGWDELWLMNADGSDQHFVYHPGSTNVAWPRSWSADGRYIAFSQISFVYYQGNWYWNAGRLKAWDTAGATVVPLGSGTLDWKPDWQTTDAVAPTSSLRALAQTSPGPFTVDWSGEDTGGSGLKNFDVQVKEGVAGAWSDWQMGVTATSASYPGLGGRTYAFRSRARDNAFNVEAWPADYDVLTTVEALPPLSRVDPLPAYARSGLPVTWRGNDPGGSGIAGFFVQVRQGVGGAWTSWQANTTATTASFEGTPGQAYFFRARAVDRAQNLEAWPPGDGDATTTLYTWAVTGQATDNRAAPVVDMTVTTAPAAFHTAGSDGEGRYAAHVATPAASYTVTGSKAGYGALPATAFPANPDASLDLVLPPVDNLVQNWGFETGSFGAAWQTSGTTAPVVVADGRRHTGAYGALLQADYAPGAAAEASNGISGAVDPQAPLAGFSSLVQTLTLPPALAAPTLSFYYQLSNLATATGNDFVVTVEAGSNSTTVFTSGAATAGWTHRWVDLSPWAGQTIAVRFTARRTTAGVDATAAIIDEVTVGSAHPDLWINAVSGAALPGRQFQLDLSYGNRGGVAASVANVTLQLPPGLTFVSAAPPPSATAPILRWNLGTAAAQSGPQSIRVTVLVAASASPGSTLTATASIASDTTELELANNTSQGAVFAGSRGYLPVILH